MHLALPFLIACTGNAPDEIATDDSGTDDTEQPTDDTAPTDSGQPDTVAPMSPDGTIDHLAALAKIAAENGGSRHAGSPGFDASADYVAQRLEDAGYTVIRDAFTFRNFVEISPPVLEITDGTTYTPDVDFTTMTYSGAGDVTAPIEAVDVTIPPGENSNTSTSGCEPADFDDFTAGNIALIQRGTCTFSDKVSNAAAAGAVGVVMFNEGQEGRQDAFSGTLSTEPAVDIPVVSASYALGEAFAADAPEIHLVVDVETAEIQTTNILTETAGFDDRIIVIGAHLDSVSAGAGINDNGSGSAAILELAEELARVGHAPVNRIRFAFWGAEELGLLGSTSYVSRLSEDDRGAIVANLNFDMLASPNYGRFVYDGDGSATGTAGPTGSDEIEAMFVDWFDSQKQASSPTAFSGRSDYGPFIAIGIPAGGLFTGAEKVKSAEEAEQFGGEADVAFDICYHQGCDGLENINNTALAEMSAAVFAVSMTLADDADPLGQEARAARPPVDLAAAMWQPERRGEHLQR